MIAELLPIEETREEQLLREMEELRSSLDKYRKAQFARIGALNKKCDETLHELNTLKCAMVKCDIVLSCPEKQEN